MKITNLKISISAILLIAGVSFVSCGPGNMGGDATKSEGADAINLNAPVNTNQRTSSDMNITPSDYTNSPESRSIDTIKPKTKAAPR
jgi:hypothetical protein